MSTQPPDLGLTEAEARAALRAAQDRIDALRIPVLFGFRRYKRQLEAAYGEWNVANLALFDAQTRHTQERLRRDLDPVRRNIGRGERP